VPNVLCRKVDCHVVAEAPLPYSLLSLFLVVIISLAAFLSPLPLIANEQWPHAVASHLPPIPILITTKLAITLAINLIIIIVVAVAVAIAIAVAIAVAIPIAAAVAVTVAIAIAFRVAVAITVIFAIALAITVAIVVALAIAIAIAVAIAKAVAVAFTCVICTRAVHNNKPMRRCLQEGCEQCILPGRRRFLIRLEACKEILLAELEKVSCCDGGLHGVPLPGGQHKKSANVAALSGGGSMPLY
jgi:hypothetical protein